MIAELVSIFAIPAIMSVFLILDKKMKNRETFRIHSRRGYIEFIRNMAIIKSILLTLGLFNSANASALLYEVDFRPSAVTRDGTKIFGTRTNDIIEWTLTGGKRIIASLPSNARIWDVSDDGGVLVGQLTSNDTTVGFRWTRQRGIEILNSVNAIRSISADGRISVGTSVAPYRGYIWNGDNVTSTLNFSPIGIAPDGNKIAGYASLNFPTVAAVYPVSTGQYTYIPNQMSSVGYHVESDTVVGTLNSSNIRHLFFWRGNQVISYPLSSSSLFPLATSTDTSKVLIGNTLNASPAYIFDEDRIILLSDYLSQNGINTTGWNFTEPRAMNYDGSIIVGIASNRNFIAIIPGPVPEPSSFIFLLALYRRVRS
jgi:hypothetical protein